jgi:ElaB/YqjD/DUF883 family membrane-anchored ribosome-binding protein
MGFQNCAKPGGSIRGLRLLRFRRGLLASDRRWGAKHSFFLTPKVRAGPSIESSSRRVELIRPERAFFSVRNTADPVLQLHLVSGILGVRLRREARMHAALMEQTEQLKENVSRAARDGEQRLTHFGKEVARMKAAIPEAIEDRMKMARRTVKHGYRATTDFVDDTAYRIKRDPLRALGLSFAVGVAAGWLLPHRTRG